MPSHKINQTSWIRKPKDYALYIKTLNLISCREVPQAMLNSVHQGDTEEKTLAVA